MISPCRALKNWAGPDGPAARGTATRCQVVPVSWVTSREGVFPPWSMVRNPVLPKNCGGGVGGGRPGPGPPPVGGAEHLGRGWPGTRTGAGQREPGPARGDGKQDHVTAGRGQRRLRRGGCDGGPGAPAVGGVHRDQRGG